MLSRIGCTSCLITLALLSTAFAGEPPVPPAPMSLLPPVRAWLSSGEGRFLSSEAYSQDATTEALPECHPLPCLNEAAFRIVPDSPKITAAMQLLRVAAIPSQSCAGAPDIASGTETADRPATPTPLEHLRMAAQHLEAAGRTDDAAAIREQIEEMRNHHLRRLAELRHQKQRIEREIASLEVLTSATDAISFQCTIAEVPSDQMYRVSRTATPVRLGARANPEPRHDLFVLDARPSSLLESIRSIPRANVIAQPRIVTSNGRSATISVSCNPTFPAGTQSVPCSCNSRPVGLNVTLNPTVKPDGDLRLEIATETNPCDPASMDSQPDSQQQVLTSQRMCATCDLAFGQSVVVSGVPVARSAAQSCTPTLLNLVGDATEAASTRVTKLLVIVTPSRIE